MRNTAWMFLGAIAIVITPAMAMDGDALAPTSDQLPWARWQGRVSLGTNASLLRLGGESPALKLNQASLMGDYYFARPSTAPGRLGGFRATSGLIFGSHGVLSTGQPGAGAGSAFSIGSRLFGSAPLPYGSDSATDSTALPYLGLGYTGLSARNGWSFSADLGMVAQGSGNGVRLGRIATGGQSLDDAVRDLRLAPLLQLGVSYSF